jgi:hypothetical protein
LDTVRPLLERAATWAAKIDNVAPGNKADNDERDHGANDSRGRSRHEAGADGSGEKPDDYATAECAISPSMRAQEIANALNGRSIGEHRMATLSTGRHVDGFSDDRVWTPNELANRRPAASGVSPRMRDVRVERRVKPFVVHALDC